jgi:CHAT domain-containing protein
LRLSAYIHTEHVVIAPHSILHYLPFGALHDNNYLVEQYAFSYTPAPVRFLRARYKPT